VPQPKLTGTFTRFWAGLGSGIIVGWAVFRGAVFAPGEPEFQCITVGALLAGILALVRLKGSSHALALVLAYGAVRLLAGPEASWTAGLSGVLLGLGILIVAMIYEELEQSGLRFGKFLLVGPLLGGIYLAVSPIADFGDLSVLNAAHYFVFQFLLGFVIGDGVAFGIEVADRILSSGRRQEPERQDA
jgi:hypothetical protein